MPRPKIYIPPYGFRETPTGRHRFPAGGRETDDYGEVLMVIYHDIDYGQTWVPHSIVTNEGVYDAEYSKRTGNLYFDLAGSGGDPYLHRYAEIDPPPARVWIKPGTKVALKSAEATEPTDEQLRAMGYLRIHSDIPSPFAQAIEDRAHWIASAEDYLPDDETHACCACDEREDSQNMNALLIVFDESGTGLDEKGLYKITRFPFYRDGMIEGSFIESSIERIGDVPGGTEEPNGYPCGFLCVKCSAKHTAPTKRSRAA